MDEFTGKATAYDKARPGYAPAALDYVLRCVNTPRAVIADIGAGTGKFSALLAARGYDVIAVEPNADMRSKLPGTVRAVNGTAENTGLPDQSVDAVTCSQAFHWFDGEKFKLECQRILRPGGRIFVVYNNPAAGHLENRGHPELEWCSHKYDPGRWKRIDNAILAFFGGEMRRETFDNPFYLDRGRHEAYLLSHSTSPKPGDAEYERYIASIEEIYARRNVDGMVPLPLETVVYTSL